MPLLDDCTVWQPRQELQQLWQGAQQWAGHWQDIVLQRVKTCLLRARQVVGSNTAAESENKTLAAAKTGFAALAGDLRIHLNLISGVFLSWLCGRSPVLAPDQFAATWQGSGLRLSV